MLDSDQNEHAVDVEIGGDGCANSAADVTPVLGGAAHGERAALPFRHEIRDAHCGERVA